MGKPKSQIKTFSKNGVGNFTFTNNVDAVQYTIRELIRGALSDVGKFMKTAYRNEFYSTPGITKNTRLAGSALQWWCRTKECDLQLGLWKNKGMGKTPISPGFWGGFYEVGSDSPKVPKLHILYNTVEKYKSKIIEIEKHYLSGISDDNPDLSGIDEGDIESENS